MKSKRPAAPPEPVTETPAEEIASLGGDPDFMTSLAETAQPVLERVSAAVQESCSLAVLDGDEVVYVARSAARDLGLQLEGLGAAAR